MGLKFRRQFPIGPYVADFCCHSLKLIVELDGGVHELRSQIPMMRTGRPILVLSVIPCCASLTSRSSSLLKLLWPRYPDLQNLSPLCLFLPPLPLGEEGRGGEGFGGRTAE